MSESPSPQGKRPSFKQEERHEFRYMLAVRIADIFSWLMWLVPLRLRYFLADRVADSFRTMTHTYRDNVQANVAQVLAMPVDGPEVAAAAKSIFRCSSRNFVDLMVMPRTSRKRLVRMISIEGGSWAPIDDALAKGKGVILVACHLGAFDAVGQVLSARGYRLTIVTGRTTSRFIFDGVTHLRAHHGSTMVEPSPSGVRQVIRALKRGEMTVFVADRDFFQNGRQVEFFGRKTTLPPGPIRIARDSGAMIVPLMTSRTPGGYHIEVLEPFAIEKTLDIEEDMRLGMERLIPLLEAGIRKRISQWVMFQRVWPETPAPAIRVFPVGSPLESELLEKVAQALPERRTPRAPRSDSKRRAGEMLE